MSTSPYDNTPQPFVKEYDLVNVSFALPADMREYIRGSAAANNISFNECVLRLLVEGMASVTAQQEARKAAKEAQIANLEKTGVLTPEQVHALLTATAGDSEAVTP